MLAGRVHQEQASEALGQKLALRWYAFGEASLREVFAAHSENRIDEVETESYLQEDGAYRHLPLKALAPCLSERIAVNTPFAKASYFAERNIGYSSLCAGLLALLCLIVGVVFFFRIDALRAETAALNEETRKIAESARGQVAGTLSPDFSAIRDFIDLVLAARTETDPGALLRKLRLAAGDDIKLLRMYMQPEDRYIVIEGWVDAASGGDRQLAGFLAQLRRSGFEPEAVDATIALRARPGSAFAYRLHLNSRTTGDIL
jgi:hypothetical protein